jgi:hypothetical protein
MISQDWATMRDAIKSHFMNRAWLDRQKKRAFEAHYREKNHSHEKPTDYIYRKMQLLDLVINFNDSEMIMEIMESAPPFWAQIIDTQRLVTVEQLQDAVKYHEERLENGGTSDARMDELERMVKSLNAGNGARNKPFFRERPRPAYPANVNLVGAHPNIGKPPFPKDDSTISKNGRTPESRNARACRHCGSGKHWDNECRYAKQGGKIVRSNFANPTVDYVESQEAYDELYYDSSEEEVEEAGGTLDEEEEPVFQ